MLTKNVFSLKFLSVALLFASLLATGCSKAIDDPRQIQISGTVSINGKPIESGKIMFTPKGEGPAGIASIIDGKYRTTGVGSKGVIGGPHRVDIECFVKAPGDAEEIIEGEPMPANYQNPIPKGHREDWDIPTDDNNIVKDFDLKY